QLLGSAASLAALALTPPAFADAPPAASPEAQKLNALFDVFFEENLRENPEGATQLCLDTWANAELKSKLRDDSAAGPADAKALTASQLGRLHTIDRSKLAGFDRVSYDTVVYTRESSAAVQAFDFGGNSYGPSPYVVSQLTGAYQSVPDFLDTKHKIAT